MTESRQARRARERAELKATAQVVRDLSPPPGLRYSRGQTVYGKKAVQALGLPSASDDGIPRGPDGNKLGKGCKDGYCNRTACQASLAGEIQWTMEAYSSGGTNGRLYYCDDCAEMFNRCDRDEFPQDRRGMALQRCRLELDTVPDTLKDYYLNSRYVRGEPWKVQA